MLDLLLVVEAADEEALVAQGDEAMVEALDDGLVTRLDVDHAVARVDQHGATGNGVGLAVVGGVGVEGAPGADVAPAEVGGDGVAAL